MVKGSICFHPRINKSFHLILGNVALININPNISIIVIILDGAVPKNSIFINIDMNIILLYSAKYNTANDIPPYSIRYPATNSLSASTRSNG